MLRRRHVKHTASLEERMVAGNVMELRASQAYTANHIAEWLTSPRLRTPKYSSMSYYLLSVIRRNARD
ncbi:hypothetical protein ACVWVY_003761 [Bradyrhizobium sp. URHC0002]